VGPHEVPFGVEDLTGVVFDGFPDDVRVVGYPGCFETDDVSSIADWTAEKASERLEPPTVTTLSDQWSAMSWRRATVDVTPRMAWMYVTIQYLTRRVMT
jgi:hypothetical protein